MTVRYNKKNFSKMMKKADKEKSKANPKLNNETTAETAATQTEAVVLAKASKLAFFKQYYTYQAFLEIHPTRSISLEDCYKKTILYIMRWFRNRLGEEVFEKYPETVFLRDDYPEPENYKDFSLEDSKNINGFNFIDFETAYINDKCSWLACLTEPDNGNENSGVQGRTFITEFFVNKLSESVALGIREACREPESNSEDASGFRPGFVRDIFFDDDVIITEFGIGKEYAFAKKPVILNGKSGEACERLYSDLIISDKRQMPVLFVPGDYYKKYSSEVDRKTQSLLGFAHVVVWEGSSAKLFNQAMKSEELAEVANEGQLIFYRTTNHSEYDSDYYEGENEELLEEIRTRAHKEPCRKNYDFLDFTFKPSWWELDKINNTKDLDTKELSDAYEKEISKLKIEISDLRTDIEGRQRKIDSLESENKKLDKNHTKLASDWLKSIEENKALAVENENQKNEIRKYESKALNDEIIRRGLISSEKERYQPLLNLPNVTREKKDELVKWIETYYSDVMELHPDAVKSLKDDNRNIDWHRLCMMIHYLAGYTRYRNEGGAAINYEAAREYDPENSGYKVEPAGSGQGAMEIHKDKYLLRVDGRDVLMDMHIKYGKGKDANMIRVYFYYDADKKKSVIGYLPNHLPTRALSH